MYIITGLPTHSVGARLVTVVGMSSSVTLHGGPAGGCTRADMLGEVRKSKALFDWLLSQQYFYQNSESQLTYVKVITIRRCLRHSVYGTLL